MAINENATITLTMLAKDLASGNIGALVGKIDTLAKRGGIMGSVFQGIGQSIGQMINPLALMQRGVGMVTDFLGDATKAAMEDERSVARLGVALQNNIEDWDGNTAAIEAAIEAGQDKAFTDDAQREAIGKLVIRTHDENEALRLNTLAMDLARGKGIDLAAAADLVGKAYSGQVGALRRAGLAIDANATSTEALAAIQEAFGGQAEAFAETTEGSMLAAQIALDEVVEDIGRELLPIMKDLADFIKDDIVPGIRAMGDAMGFVDEQLKNWEETLNPGGDNWWDEMEPPPGLVPEVERSGEAFRAFANVLTSEVEPAVGASTEDMARHFRSLRNRSFDYMADMEERFGEFGNTTADNFREDRGDVRDAMIALKSAIVDPITEAEQIAWLEAKLTSRQIRRGLASSNPETRADTVRFINFIKAKIAELDGTIVSVGVHFGTSGRTQPGGGAGSFNDRPGGHSQSFVSVPHSGSGSTGGMSFTYAPQYSTASPIEARRFAEQLMPEMTRAMQHQQFLPRR